VKCQYKKKKKKKLSNAGVRDIQVKTSDRIVALENVNDDDDDDNNNNNNNNNNSETIKTRLYPEGKSTKSHGAWIKSTPVVKFVKYNKAICVRNLGCASS